MRTKDLTHRQIEAAPSFVPQLIIGLVLAFTLLLLGLPIGAIAAGPDLAINFDDVDAPCSFLDTVALREEYADLSVHFHGRGPLNGGGIVNQCGNWGVTGYSPPNFLAFNVPADYSDGGSPRPPEVIAFDTPVSHVEFKAGSTAQGEEGTLTVVAFDVARQRIGSDTIPMVQTVAVASIDAWGISYLIIKATPHNFLIDDLVAS
jgi:hypothetical protein